MINVPWDPPDCQIKLFSACPACCWTTLTDPVWNVGSVTVCELSTSNQAFQLHWLGKKACFDCASYNNAVLSPRDKLPMQLLPPSFIHGLDYYKCSFGPTRRPAESPSACKECCCTQFVTRSQEQTCACDIHPPGPSLAANSRLTVAFSRSLNSLRLPWKCYSMQIYLTVNLSRPLRGDSYTAPLTVVKQRLKTRLLSKFQTHSQYSPPPAPSITASPL